MTGTPMPTQIDSWKAAEKNAAAWMRHWGYTDAAVTAGGPDGGIDVRADGALAQVKFEAVRVGAPLLQRLVGARGLDHDKALFFFTGAGYAKPAVTYANTMSIALFKYGLDGSMTPVNAAASKVVTRAAAQAEARARAQAHAEAEARPRARAEARARTRARARPPRDTFVQRRHPPVENFPLDEVRAWIDATTERRAAETAATAGWWRRNGWLVAGACCLIGAALTGSKAITEPHDGAWAPFYFCVIPAFACLFAWLGLADRRDTLVTSLATLPAPPPLPPAARDLALRLPSSRPGADWTAEDKATREFLDAVPDLAYTQARIIIRAAHRERPVARLATSAVSGSGPRGDGACQARACTRDSVACASASHRA